MTRHLSIAVLLAPAVVLSLLLALAAWPAANLAPRDIPIGLVATDPVATQLSARLKEGGFDVRAYVDASRATTAIRERDIYGAIVMSGEGSQVLTASAASPVIAESLRSVAGQIANPIPAAGPTAVDVVPTPVGDPRGTGFAASLFPLLIASILTAATTVFAAARPVPRLLILGGSTLLTAIVATVLMREWLGVLGGEWIAVVATIWLALLAMATVTAGLSSALGYAGLAAGAALIVMIGNPLSGVTSSPHLLPDWASTTGALLPPGAFATLLRSAAFFDGNSGPGPVLVLLGWLTVGIVLIGLPRRGAAAERGLERGSARSISRSSPAAPGSTLAS